MKPIRSKLITVETIMKHMGFLELYQILFVRGAVEDEID